MTFDLGVTSIDYHLGTLLFGAINKANHLLLVLLGNHRTKVIAGIGAGTHF